MFDVSGFFGAPSQDRLYSTEDTFDSEKTKSDMSRMNVGCMNVGIRACV